MKKGTLIKSKVAAKIRRDLKKCFHFVHFKKFTFALRNHCQRLLEVTLSYQWLPTFPYLPLSFSPCLFSVCLSSLCRLYCLSSTNLRSVVLFLDVRWLPVGFEQTAHLFIFGRNYLLPPIPPPRTREGSRLIATALGCWLLGVEPHSGYIHLLSFRFEYLGLSL